MIDSDGSGRVSVNELEMFLKSIAPHTVSKRDVANLARQVMQEVDTNMSQLINYQEFCNWSGKPVILEWIEAPHVRVVR